MEPAGPSRAAQSLLRYETSLQPLPILLQAPGFTRLFGAMLCAARTQSSLAHTCPPWTRLQGPQIAVPCCIISTICTTLSMCFRAAMRPCSISIL